MLKMIYFILIYFIVKNIDKLCQFKVLSQHHILPESGWISKYLKEPGDVDTAIKLLKRSYEIVLKQKNQRIVNN